MIGRTVEGFEKSAELTDLVSLCTGRSPSRVVMWFFRAFTIGDGTTCCKPLDYLSFGLGVSIPKQLVALSRIEHDDGFFGSVASRFSVSKLFESAPQLAAQ